MADPTLDRDPVEFLAEEFMERLRRGEYPSVEEYASAHPDAADQIRELFPTIAAMEKLKSDKESLSGGRASLGPTKLERLGDLRIIREIGRGGMGIVYEAEQESLGRRVAVKVLPKQSLLDDKHLRRFRREAKTAARLHHTNIVPILGVGEQDGYHYYVMQIIRGVGLDEIMPQLVAVANGTAADASGALPADPHRAENVSSVARAMMEGELRHMSHTDESSDLASGIRYVSSPSTDSRAAAVTELHVANDTSESGTSFVVDEAAAPQSSTAQSSTAQSSTAQSSTAQGSKAQGFGPRGETVEEASTRTIVMARHFSSAYWQSVARIGVQVANALQYAHRQGTLHRDIKPANLLIDGRGNMWVADFGLAKAVEQDDVSRTGDVVGTLRYMAPEQFYGEADGRSDLFSLGLTLYELLTLQPAYNEVERKRSFIHESGPPEPTRPRRINGSIPRDMETIVLKAMALEPKDRYETAAEMAEDLQRFLEDRPILARRASIPERLRRWARRNPAIALLSATAISLLLTVAVVSTAAYFQTEQARQEADAERAAAQQSSRVALGALDKIFERLAPHRYVSPEDFAMVDEEDDSLPVNNQPVLSEEAAALLTEMMKSYDELASISGQNTELLLSVASANRRLGDIRARLGQTEQALADYEKAIATYGDLDETTRQDPKTVAAIASVYNEIGQLYRHARRFDSRGGGEDKSKPAFDTAMRLLKPVAVATSSAEVRFELARSYYLRSNHFSGRSSGRGRGGGGKRSGRGPRPPRDGSPRDGSPRDGSPRDGSPRDGSPRDGSPRVGSREDGGPREGPRGEQHLDEAIELLEGLTDEYDVPDYQELLAMCYFEQQLQLPFDVQRENREAIDKSIRLLEELVELYPKNPDYSFTLSKVYGMTAYQSPNGLEFAKDALSILQRLQKEHPGVPGYRMSQIGMHHVAARQMVRSGDYEAAAEHFQAARELGASLSDGTMPPGGMALRFFLMRNAGLGFAIADEVGPWGDLRKAAVPREWLVRARDELTRSEQTFIDASEKDPRTRGMLGMFYSRLATLHGVLGDKAAKDKMQAKAKEFEGGFPQRHRENRRPGRGDGRRD